MTTQTGVVQGTVWLYERYISCICLNMYECKKNIYIYILYVYTNIYIHYNLDNIGTMKDNLPEILPHTIFHNRAT